ncbi:hypothetical protein Tco_1483550 [Tanacetum coccineum]
MSTITPSNRRLEVRYYLDAGRNMLRAFVLVESQDIGPDIMQEEPTKKMVAKIKEFWKTAESPENSNADTVGKPLGIPSWRTKVLLKVFSMVRMVPLVEIEIDENLQFVKEPNEDRPFIYDL